MFKILTLSVLFLFTLVNQTSEVCPDIELKSATLKKENKCYNVYVDIHPDSLTQLIYSTLKEKRYYFQRIYPLERLFSLDVVIDRNMYVKEIDVDYGKKHDYITTEFKNILLQMKYHTYLDKTDPNPKTNCDVYWFNFTCAFNEKGEIIELAYPDPSLKE